MKKVIVIAVMLISTIGFAQDQYTKGMQKAFQLWGEGKVMEASNMFERISSAEMDFVRRERQGKTDATVREGARVC